MHASPPSLDVLCTLIASLPLLIRLASHSIPVVAWGSIEATVRLRFRGDEFPLLGVPEEDWGWRSSARELEETRTTVA